MSIKHTATQVAQHALALSEVLRSVEDMRWQAAPSTRPSERVGGSRSEVSDPTFAIVADPCRSELSDAVTRAERALRQAEGVLSAALANLNAAEDRYEGRRD